MSLQDRLGPELLSDEPLAKYTAARPGGAADWLYIARKSVDELGEVVMAAWDEDVPVRVLGGGANVLVSDRGFRGLVVVNRVSTVAFKRYDNVVVASGVSLSTLARKCLSRGLSG